MIEAETPAVIFLNGIGDHFINLPAIRALASLFPNKLTLVCRAGPLAALFSELPLKTTCKLPSTDTDHDPLCDVSRVTSVLKPCDLLISLNPWHSKFVDQLIHELSPKNSIGFFPPFTNQLKLDYGKHSAELAFDVPRFFDPSLSLERYSSPPRLPASTTGAAGKLLEPLPPHWHVMVVHGDSSKEKMWPAERLVSVLDAFLDNYDDFVVLIVGRKKIPLDCGRMSERVISCHGLPLMVSAALVAGADLFLGIDSCMLHVADMFRVPGVALFGPTNPNEFGFRIAPHRHVCGRGCMENIPVDTVVDCLNSIVPPRGGRPRRAAARNAFIPRNARYPVVIYSDGLGDTLMSLPALRALSQLLQERLTLVGSARSREILEPEIGFRAFIDRSDDRPQRVAREIGDCDLLMTADPDPDSDFSGNLIRLLSPRWSVGWAPNHQTLLPIYEGWHFCDEVFELPKFLDSGLVIESFSSPPGIGKSDHGLARAVYQELSSNQKVLVIHADTAASKMWPLDRFRNFLDLFMALHPEFLVLVVGSTPLPLDSGRFGDRVVPCHGLPLAASIALVAAADLFVGIDSSMLHAADMYRVPSVGIFGPTCPQRWGCRFTRHRHVVAPLAAKGGPWPRRHTTEVKEHDVLCAIESLWDEILASTG